MTDSLLVALLFAAAFGHGVLMTASHNWWYGGAFDRRVTDAIQLLHGLALVAGPVLFWGAVGFDLRPLFDDPWGAGPGRAALAGYVAACWFFGVIYFPLLTAYRLSRPKPAVLVSNHTRAVDVAAELGYRPLGRSKWRFLARLPGNEAFTVDFAERTLRLPRLPAEWDGLSILHLTDFHWCGTPDREYHRWVLDQCAAWGPDLVAFTGDLVDTDYHYRWVVPLMGRLRWREHAFAILGNHDAYHEPAPVRRRLGKVGFQVIGTGWKQVEVRGRPLVVIGHEGPWFGGPPDLTDCPRGPFRLCLSHTPDHIAWARKNHVDLMLSGHVHGGQVQFPLVGPVVVPSRYGRRYACGTFHEPPTVLHVGRGLGGKQPLRYNCRPEVTKLVLRRVY